MTESITYQPIEKLYIGVSGSVEVIPTVTQANALGQIETALITQFGVSNTTFAISAYETKITSVIQDVPCVIQHKTDFFNVQKDYMTPGGSIIALTSSQSNIALYPIYSGIVNTDVVSVVPNSVKLWVNNGVSPLPVLIANETAGIFTNAHSNYIVSGIVNYSKGANACSYNISSGLIDTVYLTYKTQDNLGNQTKSIRTPYGWQITDVDNFMIMLDFNAF